MTLRSLRIASGAPSAMMRPSASTRMRVQSDITNSMLCSITTKVERRVSLIALRRSRRPPSIVGLTPPAGSSSSTRRGPAMKAIATSSSFRSEEHTSELQSHLNLVCRLLLEKKKKKHKRHNKQKKQKKKKKKKTKK